MPPIVIYTGDELPPWEATFPVNDAVVDYSVDHTFRCDVVDAKTSVSFITNKTNGIIGSPNGVVTVTFTAAETLPSPATLQAPKLYVMFLTPTRISDNSPGPTVEDTLEVRWRPFDLPPVVIVTPATIGLTYGSS